MQAEYAWQARLHEFKMSLGIFVYKPMWDDLCGEFFV